MIIANMNWTKENVWEFVKHHTLHKSKLQKILFAAYIICALLLLVFGITAFVITAEIMVLLFSLGALLVMCAYVVFFYFMMKSMAKKLLEANSENENLEICFNDEVIFVRKNNEPMGIIPWDNITDINIGASAAYITSKENALILIEFKCITTGKKEDFLKLLEVKNIIIRNNVKNNETNNRK